VIDQDRIESKHHIVTPISRNAVDHHGIRHLSPALIISLSYGVIAIDQLESESEGCVVVLDCDGRVGLHKVVVSRRPRLHARVKHGDLLLSNRQS
jgi:hypothetical protein